MGVPESDRHLLLEWTNRVIGYQDDEHAQVVRDERGRPVNPRSPAMLAEMFAYAGELADHKRRHPADDVMTALVEARVDGESLDDTELQMFFFLLTIAGNDTVRSRAARRRPGARRAPRAVPPPARGPLAAAAARSRRCSAGTRRC